MLTAGQGELDQNGCHDSLLAVDGVVDIIDGLGQSRPVTYAESAPSSQAS